MTSVKTPSVLWAQRSSVTNKEKNFIYLSVNLQGIIHSSLQYTVTDTTISLKVDAKEADKQREYAFELDFYAEVVPGVLKECTSRTPQSVTMVIFKKDLTAHDWPQLSKAALAYVRTDFSRWTWEGDESDDEVEDGSTDAINMYTDSSLAETKGGRLSKQPDQGLAPLNTSTLKTPQVLWAQRSSPIASMKNIVCLSVYAQDIAKSTLKCIVTDSSISFRAYAREHCEERELAFDLAFYADVIPEMVEKYLTEQCFTIILPKKQMDNRYWPRLQKAEGELPYISTDFKRWTWEDDQSDDIIHWRALGASNGQSIKKAVELNHRGIFFSERFTRLGEIGDLENAIASFGDAVLHTPDGHEEKAGRSSNLGSSLRTRFEHLGEMGDIEKAISILEDVVLLVPDGHPDKARLRDNLGVSLLRRFERLGEIGDIERAISNLEDAVQLAPDGDADKPDLQTNLGLSLSTRFERLGEIEDLEKAIAIQEDALQATPDHASKPAHLTNLGISLLKRFDRLGKMEDIERAISSHEDALQVTPDGHTSKSRHLNNLGISLSRRFDRLGETGDRDRAISSFEDAVHLTPEGHANRSRFLNSLGNSLLCRFKCLGEMRDIQQAISSYEDAVRLAPDGHVDKTRHQLVLGDALLVRFERLGDFRDLEQSIYTASKAATQSSGAPSTRFRASLFWARGASLCNDLNVSTPSVFDAYSTAYELLPRICWLGLSIPSLHRELIIARTLACDAAATAISANNFFKAIEWLEQGRSVLWGQILQRRTPLDPLRNSHPELAAKLTWIAGDLERSSPQPFLLDGHTSPEQSIQQRRQLAHKWEMAVDEVRKLPNFDRFLLPKQYSELQDAGRNGPVVILNASKFGCDALIIAPPLGLQHIHLDKLTYEHADSLRKSLYVELKKHGLRYERGMREAGCQDDAVIRYILSQLWELIVKPILGCFERLQSKGNIRIWWCPTGPLAFLPIHAAGIYNADGTVSCSLDDIAVSSYTPSLTALLNSSRRKVSKQAGGKLLVVLQSNTPGVDPLPGTKKELQHIREHAPDAKVLQGRDATVMEVAQAMKKCHWVHFACHGIQDAVDPMNSGLRLSDGLLRLSDIIKEPLPDAEFAFLSACQTATGDEDRPEEAIHLAAGMLLAGYRGVVATMWSIQDDIAPFVADKVYGEILRDGNPNSEKAAQALHTAVRDLRQSGCSFASWVPFIHMGV